MFLFQLKTPDSEIVLPQSNFPAKEPKSIIQNHYAQTIENSLSGNIETEIPTPDIKNSIRKTDCSPNEVMKN